MNFTTAKQGPSNVFEVLRDGLLVPFTGPTQLEVLSTTSCDNDYDGRKISARVGSASWMADVLNVQRSLVAKRLSAK